MSPTSVPPAPWTRSEEEPVAKRPCRRAAAAAAAPAPGKARQERAKKQGTLCKSADGIPRVPRPLRNRIAAVAPRISAADDPSAVLRSLSTIVISLDRRPDRLDGCAARLAARCPGLGFARFSATDGKASSIDTAEVSTSWHTARNVIYQKLRSVRKGWDDLDTYQERRLPMSPGERGCAYSHIRAWRHCLELAGGSDRPLLVLEDDAAPTAEFAQTLARALASLPSDANLLYLGYSQAAEWRREVTPELVEAEYVWTTVGYIIWPAAARALLSCLPVNEPVDNWMAALCAEGRVKAYCVRPKIILQADAWNVNSDVSHSDEHYWGPNSDIQHTDADPCGGLAWGSSLLGPDSDSDASASEAEAEADEAPAAATPAA